MPGRTDMGAIAAELSAIWWSGVEQSGRVRLRRGWSSGGAVEELLRLADDFESRVASPQQSHVTATWRSMRTNVVLLSTRELRFAALRHGAKFVTLRW